MERFNREKHPANSKHHDVLVITPTDELYRFVVDKRTGDYDEKPQERQANAVGSRKVRRIAAQEPDAGVAFAMLPVKEEPASSAVSCYLINSHNLNYVNPWTKAAWNDHPEAKDAEVQRSEPTSGTASVLLALANGDVLNVSLHGEQAVSATRVDLDRNPEVWRLLRNGCVAGCVNFGDPPLPVPLFNVASIARRKSGAKGAVPKKPEDLGGTLDFKWPPGATIRVAFTKFHPKWGYGVTAKKAESIVMDHARQWTRDADISLQLVRNGDYDILVSLEPLTGKVKRGDGVADPRTVVSFPVSQLGAYAARVDQGEPTIYLGWPKGLLDEDGKPLRKEAYIHSEAFRHFVLHEFGHALGLPHLHQHPDLPDPFVDTKKAIRLIKRHLGIDVDAEYVEEDLKDRWRGARRWSEWPKLPSGSPQERLEKLLTSSIMMGLPVNCIVRNARRTRTDYLTELGPLDHEWIVQLYGRRSSKKRQNG